MVGTARSSTIAKSAQSGCLLLALFGAGAGGCFGDPKNFHPGQRQGQGGSYGYAGQSGYGGGGGGGGTGGQSGSTQTCSATAQPAFSVHWSIEDSARALATCTAVGGATMDIDVLEVATTVASHFTFPCDALAGTSGALAPGEYSIAMRLRDAGGALLSEAIAPTTYGISAGCTTDLGLVPFEATVTTPDQYITLSWLVDRVLTGAPLSCADAHASRVELDVDTTVFSWACSDGQGATASLPPNTYSVAVKLLDATGTALSVTPSMPVSVTAGQPKALGTVTFDVN